MKKLFFIGLLLCGISSKAQTSSQTVGEAWYGYIDIPSVKWNSKDTVITGDKDKVIKQLMSLVDKIGSQKELSDYMLGLPTSLNFKNSIDKSKYEHANKLWRANKGFDFDYFNTKPYFTYKSKNH